MADTAAMQKTPAFAVLRFDRYLTGVTRSPEETVVVVKVMLSKVEADAEAARLNELSGDKDCHYWVGYTRLMTASDEGL
jgi:hypothetical protein